MSDCSTQAMAPKEQPKTCGTCANFVKEPYKQHAGACMGSYDTDTCTYHATNIYRCEDDSPWCPGWRQKEPEPLEQVARDAIRALDDGNWLEADALRDRLEALGVSVDD